jgi:hypothetical protein
VVVKGLAPLVSLNELPSDSLNQLPVCLSFLFWLCISRVYTVIMYCVSSVSKWTPDQWLCCLILSCTTLPVHLEDIYNSLFFFISGPVDVSTRAFNFFNPYPPLCHCWPPNGLVFVLYKSVKSESDKTPQKLVFITVPRLDPYLPPTWVKISVIFNNLYYNKYIRFFLVKVTTLWEWIGDTIESLFDPLGMVFVLSSDNQIHDTHKIRVSK